MCAAIKRILVISPPLILKSYRARWKRLAKLYGIEIVALVPSKRKDDDYGDAFYISTEEEKDGDFELKVVETTSENYCRYLIRNFSKILQNIQPDVIFCVHHEGILQLIQTILYRWLFLRKCRLVYFSMTAFPRVPKMKSLKPKEFLKQIYFRLNWWLIRHGTDGALCHNDIIEHQMRAEGYQKPVLQQTQYGVNPDQFRADTEAGQKLKEEYGLEGVVIGFCGRFVSGKGIYEIMDAFGKIERKCSLLLVGDGELRSEIEKWRSENKLPGKVYITGYAPHHEVQKYFQAMDIFVLGHRPSPTYFDNFPLVVAQAMATGIPVVGANGGGIPYQLGGEGLLFEEGNSDQLRMHLVDLMDKPEKRKAMGKALRNRALANYCVDAMNEKFVEFVEKKILRK